MVDGSIIWGLYSNSVCDSIERVQKCFLKFVTFKLYLLLEPHITKIQYFNLYITGFSHSTWSGGYIYHSYTILTMATLLSYLLNYTQFKIPLHHHISPSFFYAPYHNSNFTKTHPYLEFYLYAIVVLTLISSLIHRIW